MDPDIGGVRRNDMYGVKKVEQEVMITVTSGEHGLVGGSVGAYLIRCPYKLLVSRFDLDDI